MSHFNHFPPGTLSDACRQNSIIDPSGKSDFGVGGRWDVRSKGVFFDGNCQGSSNGTHFGGIKQCKFMVNLRIFHLTVHCLGW